LEKLLKVLLLKDQWLLASVEEIEDVEFGDPDCILHRPMFVEGDQLTDWLPFADEKLCVIRSSDIITFVEPSESLLAQYYNGNAELLTE
jgi:hypothetical protein